MPVQPYLLHEPVFLIIVKPEDGEEPGGKVLPGIPENCSRLLVDFADLLEIEIEREDSGLRVLEDLPVPPFLHQLAGEGGDDDADGDEDIEECKTRGIQPPVQVDEA